MKALSGRLPIALAPMAGPGNVALTAAVGRAGGFGIHACAYLPPERIVEEAEKLRSLSDSPFGINLFIEAPLAEVDDADLEVPNRLLDRYRDELGIAKPAKPARPPDHFEAQFDALIAARPAVFSFTFGIPPAAMFERCRAAGIETLGTATTVAEARALEAAGADAICAQGSEAGAHRGTFLAPVAESLIGTLALVPQVVDAVRVPVLAAGGITDGRGLAAVLALGACAAQIGTAFLLADEAGTAPAYRAMLGAGAAKPTAITTAFSGRAARGIVNRAMRELETAPQGIAPYPFQNALTRDVRNAASVAGRAEFLSLWAGQAASLARSASAAAIVARLMREAHAANGDAERTLRGRDRA